MGKRNHWFWRTMRKVDAGVKRFMTGRYGMDKLNSMILWVSVATVLLAVFLPLIPKLVLTAISYILIGIAIFRALSHKTYKRYRENRRFLMLLDRIKDREHRYFDCPKCRQLVRVPRGKGKIAITCPKCSEKFTRKT
jgi:hypothetical protein